MDRVLCKGDIFVYVYISTMSIKLCVCVLKVGMK